MDFLTEYLPPFMLGASVYGYGYWQGMRNARRSNR